VGGIGTKTINTVALEKIQEDNLHIPSISNSQGSSSELEFRKSEELQLHSLSDAQQLNNTNYDQGYKRLKLVSL
jgi:hypothetical protein